MTATPAIRLLGEVESPRPLRAHHGLVSVKGWCFLAGEVEPPAVRLATEAGQLEQTARHKRPDLERPFRTPLVPLVPILGILSCFGLMATLPGDTWLRLLVWLLIGFVIYFSYGRKHSHLQQEIAARRPTTP